jgi:EAL domain-containing protein (putative c-di-GMP-specific phosphodiesterase class I)
LRQAIALQLRLAADDLTPAIAVNLSGRLLGDAAFIAMATRLLDESPAQIYLEITETATIDNQDQALRNIAALKTAGARISLDDYGQGLSSLAYLRRIPADELKIDKAFVQLLGEQQRDALLVKSTIDLAHSLGLKITAEGVETEAALAALTAMGCDMVQGYLIAKPMPEAEFVRFLKEMAPRRASA